MWMNDLLHVHTYSLWSDPVEYRIGEIGFGLKQTRKCQKCGKVQIRHGECFNGYGEKYKASAGE